LKHASHWQSLARNTFKKDMDEQQQALTESMMQQTDPQASATERIEQRPKSKQEQIQSWNLMMAELKAVKSPEFAMFSVALRELLDIAQSTRHSGTSDDAL